MPPVTAPPGSPHFQHQAQMPCTGHSTGLCLYPVIHYEKDMECLRKRTQQTDGRRLGQAAGAQRVGSWPRALKAMAMGKAFPGVLGGSWPILVL